MRRRRQGFEPDASPQTAPGKSHASKTSSLGNVGAHLRCTHASPHPALFERMLYCLVDIFCRGFRPKAVRALTGHQADRTSSAAAIRIEWT